MKIERLADPVPCADKRCLFELLAACVHDGASIGFVEPLDEAEVEAFWRKVFLDVSQGTRLILVAREFAGGPVIGSAQAGFETRSNGRHRAEVQKVLVFPEHRRKGIGAALMGEVEAAARSRGVTLLFLDTSEGKGGARALYEKLGYTYAGGIPGYALDPDGTPASNAIFYKELR